MNPLRLLGFSVAGIAAIAAATGVFASHSSAGLPDVSAELSSRPRGHAIDTAAALSGTPPPASGDVEVIHPLAALEDEEVGALVQSDPAALGSMSFGLPNRGRLLNAVEFPDSPYWTRADPIHSWGTRESVEFVEFAIRRVNEQYPASPVLFVGDFSAHNGGYLRPHKSHQSGRDVDIGYYYLDQSAWYRRANARNLDRPRTWALLKALLMHTLVEYVFMDRRIQPLLQDYALAQGEDPEWLSLVFEGTSKRSSLRNPIVRHLPGHATHFHVRFENPTAELTARRSFAWLEQAGLLPGQRRLKRTKAPAVNVSAPAELGG